MGKREALLEHADALQSGLLDIGRASRESGVSVKMIRHYEAIGLLKNVARTFANYRVYSAADVHTLRFIKRARTLGFSIEDIRALVSLWQNKSRSSAAVKKIAGGHLETLQKRIAEMQAMAATLRHLTHHCHGDQRPDCPILEDLAGAGEAGA
jgi:Cu(I)-responsive transcriptional regulator